MRSQCRSPANKEVASGNFEQIIEVRSGDAIEELANEFKLIAEQLKASYEDLFNSNGQRSEALDTLKATQEHVIQQERLLALDTIASGIAHDFNNALSPILDYSEFLLEDTDEFNESTVK